MMDAWLDVSVRWPAAQTYLPAPAGKCMTAAHKGEDEKRERYPTKSGRSVTPLIVESFGMMGPCMSAWFWKAAAAAAYRRAAEGCFAGGIPVRWRIALSRSLARWNGIGVESSLRLRRGGMDEVAAAGESAG